jgi:tetratricopeptide (TPR) repeat protein
MTLAEMERRYFELKGKLAVGAISEEEFKSELERLRFQDTQGRWWMIGAQSGKWYFYDGARWLVGQPAEARAAEPPPAPEPVTAPMPPMPGVPPTVEMPRVAPAPRAVQAYAPARPVNVRPFLILGGAIVVGIVLVAIMWLVVDTFAPNKPISTLLGLAPKRTPAPAFTPTPEYVGTIANLLRVGDQLVAESQFQPALAQFDSAAQLDDKNADVHAHWARALALQGNLQEALTHAQKATRANASNAYAQAQLARILVWNGQTDAAISAGEKAVALDADSAEAHAALAEVYLRAGRNTDARKEAQAALQADNQNVEAHRANAWVLTVTGQKDAAVGEWQKVITLTPNLFFYHFEFGEAQRVFFNDPNAAIPEYQRAVSLNPSYVGAYNALGQAYLAANQPADAVSAFLQAITYNASSPEAFEGLGLAFQKQNACPQAIPYFQQALQLDANSAIAKRGLFDCGVKTPGEAEPPVPPAPEPRLLPPPTIMP